MYKLLILVIFINTTLSCSSSKEIENSESENTKVINESKESFFDFFEKDISKKGAWSDIKKKEFMDGCIEGLKGQSVISKEQGQKICECALDKLEARGAPNEITDNDAEEIGAECAKEVMFGNN